MGERKCFAGVPYDPGMKRIILAAVAVSVVSLSACGSSGSAVEATPTPEGPPAGGISVRSVNDLRAAVEEAGYECDDYFMRDPSPMGAEEFANCSGSITFGVFPDQWAAEQWRSGLGEMGSNVLVGDRWGINGDYLVLEELKTKLGGTLDAENTFEDALNN